MINKKDVLKIVPAGVYNGLIWMVSSVPNVRIGHVDKTAHLLEYGTYGFLLAFGLGLSRENFDQRAKYCIFLGLLSGAIDEFHQHFVPGRSMDVWDLCADVTGIALGVLVLFGALKLSEYLSKKLLFTETKSE